MAGYGNHAITCAQCGGEIEFTTLRRGIEIYLDYRAQVVEYREESGSGAFMLEANYSYLSCTNQESYDSEWVDGETNEISATCPSCSETIDDASELTYWGWNDDEGELYLDLFTSELGYAPGPDRYPIRDGYGVEVLDLEGFIISLNGELDEVYDPKAKPKVFQAGAIPEFETDWDGELCGHTSGEDDYGDTWSCDLPHGHPGWHQIDPNEYEVVADGIVVSAWDDNGAWVATESAIKAGDEATEMGSALSGDLFGALGI